MLILKGRHLGELAIGIHGTTWDPLYLLRLGLSLLGLSISHCGLACRRLVA